MTADDQKPEPTVDARALLKDIQARHDVFRNFSPLAIGIDKQLLAQQPDASRIRPGPRHVIDIGENRPELIARVAVIFLAAE